MPKLGKSSQAVNDVVQFIEQTQNLSGLEMAFVEEAIGPHDTEGFKELRKKTRVQSVAERSLPLLGT